MTVDPDGNPWMGGCSGPVSTYDVNAGTWITIPGTSACHRGMAADHDFHVWLVDQEGWAWKIDPANPAAMQMMTVPGSHYVYSDMTGGQLKSVSPPPA